MELTYRQKVTLEHLKRVGITKPMDIIRFCIDRLSLPHYGKRKAGKRLAHSQTRKHSKQHYQGIIDFLAQQPLKQENSPANIGYKQGS